MGLFGKARPAMQVSCARCSRVCPVREDPTEMANRARLKDYPLIRLDWRDGWEDPKPYSVNGLLRYICLPCDREGWEIRGADVVRPGRPELRVPIPDIKHA